MGLFPSSSSSFSATAFFFTNSYSVSSSSFFHSCSHLFILFAMLFLFYPYSLSHPPSPTRFRSTFVSICLYPWMCELQFFPFSISHWTLNIVHCTPSIPYSFMELKSQLEMKMMREVFWWFLYLCVYKS